jgi:hypothetical protein
MSTYFNVDWLDDDRLDMKEGLELNEFGQPINTPDIENLMLDSLVEGDSYLNLGLLDKDDFNEGNVPSGDYYYTEDIEGTKDYISGADLWSGSGAAGTLMMMDKYNQFKEKNKKRSTIANISKSLNEIEMVHNLGGGKTRTIQSKAGKSGFANSGQSNQMLETHYGDVSRTVKGMTGDIKKSILSYEGSVEALRDKHIDDTWALYSDWLAMDPERASIETIDPAPIVNEFDSGDGFGSDDTDLDDGDAGFENDYEQVINEQVDQWGTLNDMTTSMGIVGGGVGLSGWELDAVNYFCAINPAACTGSDYDNLIGGGETLEHDEVWDCPSGHCDSQGNPCSFNVYSGVYTNNQGEVCD